MTEQNVTLKPARRQMSIPENRDLIVIGISALLLILFVGKALEFGLIGNVQILLMLMASIGIVAVGQTLVVITGGIDLSVGSVVALTGVIAASLIANNLNPWLAAVAALAIGTGIGWAHGVLISRYHLAPFVVTFGSLSLVRGLAQAISNGSTINLKVNVFQWLWGKAFGLVPISAILMIAIFIAGGYLLRHSRFGRYAYAIGSNETVARLSGVNINRTRQIVYATSAFLAGLAGLLVMAQIDGGTFQNGEGFELTTIAAVIIGGTSLKGGTGGVWGTFFGIFLMSMIRTGLVLFSVPPLWDEVITGGVIVCAALIDMQRRRIYDSSPGPAATVQVISPASAVTTLDQAISRFTRTIKDRFAVTHTQVYLVDRESGELVDPLTRNAPSSTLVAQAKTHSKPQCANDLRRDQPGQMILPQPEIKAAAAAPIIYQQRLIGVVEIYSLATNAFAMPALEALVSLGTQLAGPIEANWLLESGWLTRHIRENLRNLSDEIYLDKSMLGEWLLPGNANWGGTLRNLLLEAIDYLQPEQIDPQSRAARRYQILRQTYVDQKNVDAIIHDLGLSRRQYFYDLKEAVDAVTHYLFTQYIHRTHS